MGTSGWPRDFADYVALFMQQYRAMLAQPDGAREADPWVVRLMAGMSEDTVRVLARELWTSVISTSLKKPRVTW